MAPIQSGPELATAEQIMADQKGMPSVHPLWLRIMHWLNATAVVILIMSGWRIYNATNFLHIRFPNWAFGGARPNGGIPNFLTLGGWLAGAVEWHFAAMWILFLNGCAYLLINIFTGRLKTKFFPVGPKSLAEDVISFIKGRLSHADLSHYNTIQKLAYIFAIADLIVLVCSGLVLWKSVQFPILRALMGGYETARYIHFFAMVGIVAFIIVHVAMALLVPKTILAMIKGR